MCAKLDCSKMLLSFVSDADATGSCRVDSLFASLSLQVVLLRNNEDIPQTDNKLL